MIIRRYALAIGVAAIVTFGLFFLMQFLISMEGGGLNEALRSSPIEFVRLKRDSELLTKKRKLPQKQEHEEPPPPPDIDMARAPKPSQNVDGTGVAPVIDTSLNLAGGPHLGAPSDADIIPLVRVEPQYPIRAAERGIEGWVEVEFTISPAGTVKDPIVTDYHPSSIFNRSALRAIRKWKYRPKIVDNVPVERAGVRVRLTFELEET